MSQGPLPVEWAQRARRARGLWGDALRRRDGGLQPGVGLKIVGEMMPQERNRVTLADETIRYGLPIARVTFS